MEVSLCHQKNALKTAIKAFLMVSFTLITICAHFHASSLLPTKKAAQCTSHNAQRLADGEAPSAEYRAAVTAGHN
jgi:hypothetical protein